jgi:hypothetical protein
MQQIISSEFICGHLLRFQEAFDKEKVVHEKPNVCELRVNENFYVMYLFYCFWFVFFIHVLILYAS